jgi:hypothetical protein
MINSPEASREKINAFRKDSRQLQEKQCVFSFFSAMRREREKMLLMLLLQRTFDQ